MFSYKKWWKIYQMVDFPPIFDKTDNLNDFLFFCFPAYEFPSKKGPTIKGKNLLPMGVNSFIL